MKNKLEHLKKLIDLINDEENESHKKKLWALTAKLAISELGNSRTEKELGNVIHEIHELCYEQNIRIQAASFYACFPHQSLINNLIEDFVQMEHCRRRDEFDRFCFAMYQQIENIVNHLVKHNNLWLKAQGDRNEKAFTNSWNKQRNGFSLGRLLKYIPKEKEQEANGILSKYFAREEKDLSFKERFNLVLYYNYFDQVVKDNETWRSTAGIVEDLYAIRNRNHRGEVLSERVKQQYIKIDNQQYRYYLTFMGFLADFVQKLCEQFSNENTAMAAARH